MSVTRSALAGLATGGRTFSGITALTATTPSGSTSQPDATLVTMPARAALGLLAAGELVADKLPATPNRLDFPGVHGRVLFGAACGVVAARRSATVPPAEGEADDGGALAPGRPGAPPTQVIACAFAGAVAALAASYGGARFRGWAASRTGHDWIGALVEDVAVAAVAVAAVRAPSPAA